MNEAAIYAMREESEHIADAHLTMAIDKVMMGEKTDREATQEERERVAIHELGHAIVAEIVRPGSVSTVALSAARAGARLRAPQSAAGPLLVYAESLEEQIMIALGGAAAEELFYGDRSTGSQGDFEQAHEHRAHDGRVGTDRAGHRRSAAC